MLLTATGAASFSGCGPRPDSTSPSRSAADVRYDTLSAAAVETLTVFVRDLFPGPGLEAAHYERVVQRLDELARGEQTLALLNSGVESLNAGGGQWRDRTPAQRQQRMEALETSPFFQLVRYEAAATLYSDPAVWAMYGYEGPSFDKGGYLHRGFDDLDWLPEPPGA